ncbi:hypothetical protein DACRYDRAFT_107470 [Dacryopinax primogenitus]|uniref:Uncharacterized protein n=1 Tax=Dacryopinax primogenitus (strain DJM 731) TaxID=1858805 RepID=M5GCF2_DACPD|nr:uncharacterized protein DACRYDRAFT_107470 [Dacryopinax primogenitus]EJU01728.1 hypothetical protein DACRYDRAFT_107470 [Dacryopinax primogenitus]
MSSESGKRRHDEQQVETNETTKRSKSNTLKVCVYWAPLNERWNVEVDHKDLVTDLREQVSDSLQTPTKYVRPMLRGGELYRNLARKVQESLTNNTLQCSFAKIEDNVPKESKPKHIHFFLQPKDHNNNVPPPPPPQYNQGDRNPIHDLGAYVESIRRAPSPSTGAVPAAFQDIQLQSPEYNGRGSSMLGAPNMILCEPFARYAARLRQTPDPEKYPDGFAACVQQLMQKASIIDAGRDKEDDRRKRLEPEMQEILKCELENIQYHHSKSGGNGHSRVTLFKFGHISADILVVEYKSEVGAGPAEPSFQVQLTARKGWGQETNTRLREASNCPVLLITLIGPFLQVSGVVFQPAAIVNQFTDNLSLTVDADDLQRLDRLCHVLWCTRQCIEDLQRYYSELEPPAENTTAR